MRIARILTVAVAFAAACGGNSSADGVSRARADANADTVHWAAGAPGANASLVAFNRGLPLQEVIHKVNVSRGASIWVVDPSARSTARSVLSEPSASSIMPSWSPDKQWLAFASNRGRDTDADPTPFLDIWVTSVDGKTVKRVTTAEGHDWTPAWSPDGRHIAFASTRGAADPDNVWFFDLWIVEADGKNPRRLYAGPGQDEDPVFSRDSKTVYFVSAQRGPCHLQIWQVDVAKGDASAKPLKAADGKVACGEDVSASADGKTLYYLWKGEYFAHTLGTGEVKSVARTEEPWIGPKGERYVFMIGGNVAVRALTGGASKALTEGGKDYFPRWIP